MNEQDPFEELADLNTKAYNSGFKEGIISGKKEAISKGFAVGRTTSLKIANELGHYYGICNLYRLNESEVINNNNINEKVLKLANQLCELIEKFNLVECHTENFLNELNIIRDKIKLFCSLNPNYKTYLSSQDGSTSFNKLSF